MSIAAPQQTAHEPPPDQPWVAIAANPYSGSRENRSLVASLTAELQRRDLVVREIWDTQTLDRLKREPAFAAHCRCVVAAGGDGTICRVLNHETQLPLAVLPLGTENLFAAHFRFDHDVARLAAAIEAGKTRAVDLGRIDDRIFSIVASAGFDGDVAHRLARWREQGQQLRRVKRRSYYRPILTSALTYRYPMIEVVADGRTLRGSLVMIFNLPRYGFDFDIAPHALDDDGQLDYVIFQHPGRLRLALYWLALKTRRHLQRSDVITGKASRITLRAAENQREIPLEIDGEPAGFTPCDISVLPRALQVVTP